MENQESLGMESRDVKEASVEGVQRRTKPKKHFVFCVKVTWSDGTVNLVYRRYREFLQLQAMLYEAFPKALGKPGTKKRNFNPLPSTFSSRMHIGEAIFRRMELVSYFLKELLGLESKITRSKHITGFLTPTPEDMEPRKLSPKKRARFKKRSRTNFTQTMKRLHNFGKTGRVFGNNISSPIVFEHYLVMDDYKKQAKTDINLKKGAVVDVIEKRQCGWWLVDADGEMGWAPALFLEPADEMHDASNVQKFAIGKGEIYVTSKRYVADEDDELSFDIGVNLQILEKNFDGWWKASYLGCEGWVPAMYLRKLGQDQRRNSKLTARRKSRLISTNQLRNPIEEEDDIIEGIPPEMAVNDLNKEEKKRSLPRMISGRSLLTKGKKKGAHVTIKEPGEESDSGERRSSKDDRNTIDTTVEMSTVFLQLQKRKKEPSNASPRPQTSESSPRPLLQRKALSTVVSPAYDRGPTAGNSEGSKDDLVLEMPRSQSLDSMLPSNSVQNHIHGSKNGAFTSLPDVHEKSNEEDDEAVGKISNEHLTSNEVSQSVRMERSEWSENENIADSDSGSCDISHDNFTHIELAEALDGFCKQPVDETKHFRTTSSAESSPEISPPRRSPPKPLDVPDSPGLESSRVKPPSRSSPVPNGAMTYPRGTMNEYTEDERQKTNTFPSSGVDQQKKVIRQDSIENETAVELNRQIQVWSSSSDDESDPEWAKSASFNQLRLLKTEKPPAIVIDETEKLSVDEGNNRLSLDDGVASTESFEIEINLGSGEMPSGEKYCPEIYYVAQSHAVDSEMFLAEGSYVKVIEQAETGWWLVRTEEGVRGWTQSSFLRLPGVDKQNRNSSKLEDEDDDEADDEGEDECDDDENANKQISCRVLEDYTGDLNNQEIDILEDEIVRVLHKSGSGWWCVQNEQGEVGWAPSTFLEDLEE